MNSRETISETLFEYLENKSSLIILDNCEHLVESVAAIAEEILSRSRGTKIIAPAGSLSLPENGCACSSLQRRRTDLRMCHTELHKLRCDPVVVHRARSVAPEFVLTPSNSRQFWKSAIE